jgi:hypothetical protein
MIANPEDTNWDAYRESGKLHGPQAVMLPVANNGSQHTKRSFYSESIPETDNQPFCKRLQLTFLNLSSVRDQASCSEHVGECLASEPYHLSSDEK